MVPVELLGFGGFDRLRTFLENLVSKMKVFDLVSIRTGRELSVLSDDIAVGAKSKGIVEADRVHWASYHM